MRRRGRLTNKCSLYTTYKFIYCLLCFHSAVHWHVWYHHGCSAVVVFSSSRSLLFPSAAKCQLPCSPAAVWVWEFLWVCVWVRDDSLSLRPKQRDSCETWVPLPIIQHCLMRSQGYGAGVTPSCLSDLNLQEGTHAHTPTHTTCFLICQIRIGSIPLPHILYVRFNHYHDALAVNLLMDVSVCTCRNARTSKK